MCLKVVAKPTMNGRIISGDDIRPPRCEARCAEVEVQARGPRSDIRRFHVRVWRPTSIGRLTLRAASCPPQRVARNVQQRSEGPPMHPDPAQKSGISAPRPSDPAKKSGFPPPPPSERAPGPADND